MFAEHILQTFQNREVGQLLSSTDVLGYTSDNYTFIWYYHLNNNVSKVTKKPHAILFLPMICIIFTDEANFAGMTVFRDFVPFTLFFRMLDEKINIAHIIKENQHNEIKNHRQKSWKPQTLQIAL